MELKQAGVMYPTVYDLVQELQSISQTLERQALITGTDSLRVAHVHLERSIAVLMSNYAEEAFTKTEQ
jgi:hypothetical protein